MALVYDPCIAGQLCREIKVLVSFFSTFCLDCGSTPGAAHQTAMNRLDTNRLAAVRSLVVSLRSILEKAQATVCVEEQERQVLLQSEHLYLQAAGSDASDGSVRGVHLRWELLNKLKEHLPKGNLAAPGSQYFANYGLNKPNDFVTIYRTPYNPAAAYKLSVDLLNVAPSIVSTGRFEWRYDNLVADVDFPAAKSSVYLRFEEAPYQAALAIACPPNGTGCDAKVMFRQIIQAYTGIIEVRVLEKTMFAVEISASGNPTVSVEARSNIAINDDVQPILSHRKSYVGPGPHMVMSEGMKVIRFKCAGGSATMLRIQTYEDFHRATRKRFGWTRYGDFALSIDETEVFKRLEDSSNFLVDNNWPHFEQSTATGPGKVKIANYHDRWRPASDPACDHTADPNPTAGDVIGSLGGGVAKYLDLSRDSTTWGANVTLYSRDHDATENAAIELSMLNILKLTSRDFHIARMLGLGTIDWGVAANGANLFQQYIYMAEYSSLTAGTLSDGSSIPHVIHRYLSLPTAPNSVRPPVAPAISALWKGLPPYDQFSEPTTDDEGYAKFGDVRFIRIDKSDMKFDMSTPWNDASAVGDGFFSDSTPFSRGDNTKPISYGVRHKLRVGSGSTYGGSWERPEISNDLGEYERPSYHPYRDAGGFAETIAIPDKENPLLVHRIVPRDDRQPFGYKYAIYGINWFSRPSGLTSFANEIYTAFPKRNTLIPPSNVSALYIQPEEPRLFNSVVEENDATTHGLTRIVFDWNQSHNGAYQREDATKAIMLDFYFRSQMPLAVRGEIDDVNDFGTEVEVTARSYDDSTVTDPAKKTVVPHVEPGDASKFADSSFVTSKGKYRIKSVDTGDPDRPIFRLYKTYENDTDDPRGGALASPSIGEGFLVVENLAVTAQWQGITGAAMPVVKFSDYAESKVQDDGNVITNHIGGIVATATITEEWQREGPGPDYGQPIPGEPSGVYKITFGSNVLPAYTSLVTASDIGSSIDRVEWYKGTLRVLENNTSGRRRTLEVIRIDTNADGVTPSAPTTIYVYDPDYLNPDTLVMARGIGQSRQVDVNFHPGYRVYIDLAAGGITDSQILPQGKEVSRETLIAIRSYDSGTPSASTPQLNASSLTPPVLHLARHFVEPVIPEAPDGPLFATRPDVYGKSTFTFDTMVLRAAHGTDLVPYGMMFYRADEIKILRSLYIESTVATILAQLPARATDAAFYDRWHGLVNTDLDANGHFKPYGMGSTLYTFPDPDNDSFSYVEYDPSDTRLEITPFPWSAPATTPAEVDERKKRLRLALKTAFLPLTEQPVIFDLIHDDTPLIATNPEQVLQTSPRKPMLRDANGDLLPPGEIDAYPMIKRVPVGSDWKVRFSDYTLDGASKNFYFYCTAELSNTMKVGGASPIHGPIRLVNTMPATAPEIQRINTRLADAAQSLPPGVDITVAPYPAGQGITKLRLYWSDDVDNARSVRTMQAVTPDYDIPVDGVIGHDFTGTSAIYGAPLYFRVAALRPITNEAGGSEYVPSIPSKMVMATLIDVTAPEAPTITPDPTTPSGSPLEFASLALTWNRTTYNGTYYLYELNDLGQWIKIYQVKSNSSQITYTFGEALPKEDDDGNEIFYSFKVVVENSAGLLSPDDPDSVLTI